ncbi:ORF6C domain-containing protein [Romboutsia timonensis]|uniref:ORF6C domain-containing protein n=1 Tax=Romboutsia timonensis TaxID=1776391 RepID=UPI002A819538|nr:ORF6C domain-containing protein [Romboutsia timonensis]MDY3960197.1 ORF6C domain-containing protein [Romboutsia timonensis]
MNKIQVIDKKEVLGFEVSVYGDLENPLFLAKDVANWIEHTHTTRMLESVDEDEKLNGVIFHAGQNREMTFLTEDGLYEVLMQSRKPIAKVFKKKVKTLLKDLRLKRFNQYSNLSTEMKALLMHDKKIQAVQQEVIEVKDNLNEFKDDIPLFAIECEEITKSVKRIGTKALGGKGSNAYRDKSLRAKVYSDIYIGN